MIVWLKLSKMSPKRADKILMFKDKWVKLLLKGTKTMETRGKAFQEGEYWIGCKKQIHGKLYLGTAQRIDTIEAFKKLRTKHCCDTDELPYKTTFCFNVNNVEAIAPIPFNHPKGAVSIVKFQ